AAIDERALGAVHRLEAVGLALDLELEHVFVVQAPVARLLPQALRDEDRGADLLVATPELLIAHRALERPPQALALGMPERGARCDIVEAIEIELDAKLA